MLTVATANVNGIRAAMRRGMGRWLAARQPDILCLQEVRAPDELLHEALGDGWFGVHEECHAKGRAGVAVLARRHPVAVRAGLAAPGRGSTEFVGAGRWVEADFALDGALAAPGEPRAERGEPSAEAAPTLTVISTYVHTGEADTPRQDEKYRFLAAIEARLNELRAVGRHVLLTGDLNVAHREVDIKNWKGNLRKAGFLPGERAWLDRLFGEHGWVDVHRELAGPGPGPYTWWSWRGQAFDTDAGWRIDVQIADRALAGRARKAEVDRAPSYAERWSDHAPLVVAYEADLA